jgi:hypothetical protein
LPTLAGEGGGLRPITFEGVTTAEKIVASTTLLGFDGKQAWPPRHPSIASFMAPPLHDQRYTADWGNARSDAAQKGQPDPVSRERQRIENFYADMTRQQAERRHREDVEARAKRTA